MKEITPLVLAYYISAIAEIKLVNGVKEAKRLAKRLRVENGVCWCADMQFGYTNYYGNRIIEKYIAVGNHWAKVPDNATTKREVIRLLQKRVSILKQIIKKDVWTTY